MGLFTPWFLVALAGVALPLYLHLLKKLKTTPRPVSSLMFFEARTQASTHHRRLRYYLLLSLQNAVAGAADSRLRQSVHQSQRRRARQQPAGAAGGGQLLQHARRNSTSRRQGRSHHGALRKGRGACAGGGLRVAVAIDDATHRRPVSIARRCASHSTRRWPRQLRRAGARRACHGRIRPHSHRASSVQRHATRRAGRHLLRHGAARQRQAGDACRRHQSPTQLDRRIGGRSRTSLGQGR